MVSPFLSKDESVILATDKVLFRSVPVSALVLTDKRILLIQAKGEDLSADEIPTAKLRSAKTDEQADGDPVLDLSYVTGTGEIRKERITFLSAAGKTRRDECHEWAEKLGEQITPSLGDDTIIRIPLGEKEDSYKTRPKPVPPPAPGSGAPAAGAAGKAPQGTTEPLPKSAAEEDMFEKHERLSGLTLPRFPLKVPEIESPSAPSERHRHLALALVIIISIALIAGAFLYIQHFLPTKAPIYVPSAPAGTTAPATIPTPVPTTPLSPAPAANITGKIPPAIPGTPTPVPTPVLAGSQLPIPMTGAWVHIQYAGNYSGSIGERGNIRPVSGAGEHFYQLFAQKGLVRAIIKKEDGSSRPLTVSLYQDGMLLVQDATSVPFGEINIQIELAATTPSSAITANPTAANSTGTG